MDYKIVHTDAYRVFGSDVVEVEGWTLEDHAVYSDKIIESGSHDATNKAAGFPANALTMIQTNSWDVENCIC